MFVREHCVHTGWDFVLWYTDGTDEADLRSGLILDLCLAETLTWFLSSSTAWTSTRRFHAAWRGHLIGNFFLEISCNT